MMRPKKGKTSEERFKEQFDDVLYDRMRRGNPGFKKQIIMIGGDTSKIDLGLSAEERQMVIDNVNVVFHGAATVRFDETLRRAININVRGTKLVVKLAQEIKNLKAFVHVSTAFSHCVLNHIEEQFYEPPMDPDKCIRLLDLMDDEMVVHMTPKIIGTFPNTYAFSKALGEEIVRRNAVGMPVCIIRPSIMIPTYKEPVRCWINNYYGPTGVSIGAGLGLLHILHCDKNCIADIIPADFVINIIIVACWDIATNWDTQKMQLATDNKLSLKVNDPPIYNSVSYCQNPITWGEYMKKDEGHEYEAATTFVIWHYDFTITKSLTYARILTFLKHTIPGLIADLVCLMIGKEPILGKAYKQIHKFSHVMRYFTLQQWEFDNKNVLALWDRTNSVDREKFYFNLDTLDWDDYFPYHLRGVRIWFLKDPIETLPQGRIKLRRLKYAHYTVVTVFYLLAAWFLFSILRLFLSYLF